MATINRSDTEPKKLKREALISELRDDMIWLC
jgi:hypothetical protein